MHISPLLHASLVCLITSHLAACSGGGGGGSDGEVPIDPPPTLTSMSMTPQSAAAGLTVTFNGSFSFEDAGGNLNGGAFNYIYEGTTYSFPLPADLAGITSADVTFTLVALLSSNTGEMEIPVWLTDAAGNDSNVISGTFTQLWTRQFGTQLEDIGNAITVDGSNHILVAGTTAGDLDGELNQGLSDVFVSRYAANTTRTWTRVFGSGSNDTGRGVAVGSDDSVYVTGDTFGNAFAGQVSDGSQAGFLSKFNSAGTRLWSQIINTDGSSDIAHGVAVDSSDNIYIAGETTGALHGEVNLGGWDGFLVKYDFGGNRQWTRLLGTIRGDHAYAVATDSGGNIYITGGTEDALGTDPSPGDPVINLDVFVAKYNPTGTLQWVTQLGTSCAEWGKGITVDASDNVYVTGKILTCAFPGNSATGKYDAFIAKLTSNGVQQWVKQFGTTEEESGNGVTTDSLGNVYVTGYQNSVYFTDDNEGHEIFLAKYDASGNQLWLKQEDAGYNWGNQGRAATTDSLDNIFITGSVHGQLDGHSNSNWGEDEVFILKYDSTGVRR